jgi:rubrerythrin
MKCPEHKKQDLLMFICGKDGNFVPIVTKYICPICGYTLKEDYREKKLIICISKIEDER